MSEREGARYVTLRILDGIRLVTHSVDSRPGEASDNFLSGSARSSGMRDTMFLEYRRSRAKYHRLDIADQKEAPQAARVSS